MIRKLTIILLLFLLIGNDKAMAQSPRFEQEGFVYYWALDKLISLREPQIALGVEYKTPHKLAFSFEAGLGGHKWPLPFNGIESTSNWVVLKTTAQLKYFYHKSYSKARIRRWRRQLRRGKLPKLKNRYNTKYFIGLQIAYNPESYYEKNGYYIDYTAAGSFTYFEKAAINTTKFRLGFMAGRQIKFKSIKGYFELNIALGLQIKETRYFNVTPGVAPSTTTFFPPFSENDLIGQYSLPYLHCGVTIGFY